jgi:hypothetical protein
MRRVLGIVLAAALLATALVATGCGSSPKASAPTTASGMTATQILEKSQHAMTKVTSASFTADVTLKVSSNSSSAQAMLLGQTPIALHVAGKAGDKTAGNAAVVAMTLQAGGQSLAVGLRAVDARTWLSFQGKWYAVPASKTGGARGVGATPGKTIGSLGIDPQKWAKSSTVTSEQLDGATVYHVVTTADTTKVMDDIVGALNNPALSRAAGSGAAALNRLKSSGQLKSLEKSLVSASAQYWIDATTFVVRKGTLDAKLRFGGSSATQGVNGLGVDIAYTLGGFGQPVKVTPPAHAQPLKKLTNGLSGLSAGTGVGL